MDEDSALLQRYAREGSETAFEELVRRRIGLVYGTALRRLRDPHRAQEVAQTVFSDLARKASALSDHPVLVSWMYTSTHYAVANLLRTEHRQRARDFEAHFMNANNSPGDGPEDGADLRPLLDEELNRLGTPVREAVLLRFYHGESFAGVGRALRLSEDAARKRVGRGLEQLRLRLERRGITSTAFVLSSILAEQAAFAAPESLAGAVAKAALLKGAAAVGALGPLSFMTTTKAAIGIGVALLLAGLGGVAVEATRAKAAEGELDSFRRQQSTGQTQLNDLEGGVTQAGSVAIAATASRSKAGGAGVRGNLVAAGSGGGGREAAKARGDAFLAQHPEVRTALVAYFDASHLAQYGPLYSSLGLTPDKIQAMQSLLRVGDSFGRVLQGGSVELSIADNSSGGYQEQQAAIQALLGDGGYQQYQAFQLTLPARLTTSSLAGLLVDSDAPLSTEQAQQMVSVFAGAADRANGYQYNWTSVYAGAGGILTPPQLQMLQNLGTYLQGWQQVTAAAH